MSSGSAWAENSGSTQSSFSGSSPISASTYDDDDEAESGTLTGSASGSGSDWSSYDYSQQATLGSDGLWNAPSGSGTASGGDQGSFSYSGNGNYTDDWELATGIISGNMSESGGETYSNSYGTTATLTAGEGWQQSGTGTETADSQFQYGYSGSGEGTLIPYYHDDSASASESGSGNGSLSYNYSGSFDTNINGGAWSATVNNDGSTELGDEYKLTDNDDSSNDIDDTGSYTSTTTNAGTPVTDDNFQGPPPGVGAVTNAGSYYGVDNPVLWSAYGSLDLVGEATGGPALPGVYAVGSYNYDYGLFGNPLYAGAVPGTVGAYGGVYGLGYQAAAPGLVNAVWGNNWQAGFAPSTPLANSAPGASQQAVLSTPAVDAVFGSVGAPLVPVTRAAQISGNGNDYVFAGLSAGAGAYTAPTQDSGDAGTWDTEDETLISSASINQSANTTPLNATQNSAPVAKLPFLDSTLGQIALTVLTKAVTAANNGKQYSPTSAVADVASVGLQNVLSPLGKVATNAALLAGISLVNAEVANDGTSTNSSSSELTAPESWNVDDVNLLSCKSPTKRFTSFGTTMRGLSGLPRRDSFGNTVLRHITTRSRKLAIALSRSSVKSA